MLAVVPLFFIQFMPNEVAQQNSIGWLYRDSAFFIVILSLIGFIILFIFNKYETRITDNMKELNKKVSQQETDFTAKIATLEEKIKNITKDVDSKFTSEDMVPRMPADKVYENK